jgi:hypothetical protein
MNSCNVIFFDVSFRIGLLVTHPNTTGDKIYLVHHRSDCNWAYFKRLGGAAAPPKQQSTFIYFGPKADKCGRGWIDR